MEERDVRGAQLAAGDVSAWRPIHGQLAGAFYGVDANPAEWRAKLALRDEIEWLADALAR